MTLETTNILGIDLEGLSGAPPSQCTPNLHQDLSHGREQQGCGRESPAGCPIPHETSEPPGTVRQDPALLREGCGVSTPGCFGISARQPLPPTPHPPPPDCSLPVPALGTCDLKPPPLQPPLGHSRTTLSGAPSSNPSPGNVSTGSRTHLPRRSKALSKGVPSSQPSSRDVGFWRRNLWLRPRG